MITNELDLTGETLNNYKIIGKLGRGGMATVYKAHELSLNRVVALKVLSNQLAVDKEYIRRFQREAQSAAQLNHPNIVQVFSIGEEKGIFYFAMEYIKGTSLADIKKEIGVFMPEKAVNIIKQVADALGHAHEAGLVHRDVKPSNIMIDAQNRAKVTDFGIAYVLAAETKLTREGSIIGTPEYLSPEQCEGKIVDQRSDIYSLGVTFYELLTGKTPYEADTPVSMLMKIVKGTFPPICDVNPNVPAPLCRIVEKMMKTDVTQRYATMAEVLTDLAATGIGETLPPIPTPSLPPIEMLSPKAQPIFEVAPAGPQPAAVAPAPKSNKYAAVIVTAIIVLLMGGAFAAKMLFLDKKPATTSETTTTAAANTTPADPKAGFFGFGTGNTNGENSSGGTVTDGTTTSGEATTTPSSDDSSSQLDDASAGISGEESVNSGDSAASGPETNTFTQPEKRISGATSTGQGTSSTTSSSAANFSGGSTRSQSTGTPMAVHAGPPANSCIVSAVGDSDKADLVSSYIEQILARKKYTIIDGPTVSNRSIADVAHNHIVISAKQLGTTTLKYYGSSSEQYTVALTLKVVSPATGKVITGPVSQTVKYTDLNAEENLKEAVRAMVAALKL